MTSESTSGAQATERLPFPLQQHEQVIRICRRHWIHLWPKTIYLALWALVPLVIISIVLAKGGWYEGTTAKVFWVIAALWLLYWGVRMLLNWYRYHHDIWVITNQRIVDSLKTNPFSQRLATADLVNVQDMTVQRHGLLQTMLNYGDIVCETASEGGEFVLAGIPEPAEVQLLVDRERDRERRAR